MRPEIDLLNDPATIQRLVTGRLEPERRQWDKKPESPALILPTFAELSKLEIKVEWIVEKTIPKNSVVVIHGPGGIRKTWLLLQMGSAIADGRAFVGLATEKTPVYYVDFENPLATLCDRARILGPSDMKVWHLSNPFPPPRFDSDDWAAYKSLSPGVIIIDTHRSSNLLDENSSKDQAFLMARQKELRESGFTVILIHHTAKANDRQYKGSTAIQDLSDIVLGLERVRAVGSDEIADNDDEEDFPFRFGVRGKSRFEPFSMFLRFDPLRGFYPAEDPNLDTLTGMQALLFDYQSTHGRGPNQTEFFRLVKGEMEMSRKVFRRFLVKGEGRFWTQNKGENCGSKVVVPL